MMVCLYQFLLFGFVIELQRENSDPAHERTHRRSQIICACACFCLIMPFRSDEGRIKEELFMDFKIDACRTRDEVKSVLDRYVKFYNEQRPCYAIGYDTPVNYRKRYYRGELERKNTFDSRILTEEPKFIQKRRKQAHPEFVSTSENENC